MPGPFGPNANVNVKVTAQPQQAAKQTQDAFEKALANALKSKAVQSAIAGIVKSFNTGGNQVGNSFKQAFATISRQGQQTAQSLTQSFNQVHQAAQKAFSAQTGRGANAELQTLQQHIITVTGNMQQLANASRQTFLVLEEAGRSARAAARSADQAGRDATSRATQSERLQIAGLQREAAAIRASGEVRRASISAVGQVTLQTMRTIERAVSGTFRAATTVIHTFARGAQTALSGLGRIASTAFQSMRRAAESSFRAMGNLFRTFGRGLQSALNGVSRAFQAAFRRDEAALSSSLSRRERAMQGSQSRMSRLLSPGGLGLIAGGAGIGGLLTSGFERFGEQERLQLTFEALIGDGPRATAVLQEISDFARTTAFDFTEVASSVAQFTATLGDVDEAFDMTRFLADVVSLTGGTTESLGRVRLAMTQIASAGRLDAANLKQLTEGLPGVPLAQILADKFFEGDLAAFSKARDEGELGAKISADAFFDAFQEGVHERFPEIEGFAQTAATTVSGLAQNLKENFAIFGATLIGLAEGPIKTFIGKVNDALGILGDFVKGTGIFGSGGGGGGGGAGTGAPGTNPYVNILPTNLIPFEALPPEMQDILAERNGWGPNQGFVLAAQHAAQLWDELHPDAAQAADTEEGVTQLAKLRDIIFDFGKGAGLTLGLAAAFTVLRHSLFLLINPFTLMLGVGGLLGIAFGQIYDASKPLRDSLASLRSAIGPLFEALKGLGGTLLDAFFRLLGDDSTTSGFARIGDFMSGIVDSITRGAQHLTDWVNWASEMIDLGKGSEVIQDISDRFQTLLGNILGLSDEEIDWSKALGGNDFGNILQTFIDKIEDLPIIGPIVRLGERIVSGLRTAIGNVAGFISNIWDAAFGEGDTGLAGPGQMFRNMEAEATGDRGAGTRVLDFLETTFLDPVVSWFRGPFADAIENIGEFVGGLFESLFDFGGRTSEGAAAAGGGPGAAGAGNPLTRLVAFLTERLPALEEARTHFGDIFSSIAAALSDAWAVIQPIIQPLIDKLGELFDAIKDWDFSNLDIGNIAGGAGLGGLIGLILGGPTGLALGAVGGALFGAGIGGAIVESINNAWTEIRGALSNLWENITSYISATFTAENIRGGAVFLLNFFRDAGELVANLVSDPVFVGAIAGVAVAAGAIVVAFTSGLVSGLSGAFLQWSNLFADFLESAWTSMDLNFIPEPIANAIAAVLGSPTSGAIAIAGSIALGGVIVSSLIGGITSVGPALVRGAGGLVGMIFGKSLSTSDKGIGVGGQNAAFKGIGTAIAGSVVAGIVDFEIGRQAGRTGSVGNVILAMLTGGAAGAAIGTAIFPGIGTAVGAALGVGISGIGALFGSASRAAQQAKDETQEYLDVLQEVADLAGEGPAAVATTVLQNLRDEAQSTQDFLVEAGFNARDFADEIIAGTFDLEDTFLQLADNEFFKALDDPDLSRQGAQAIQDLLDDLRALDEQGKLTQDTLRDALVMNPEAMDAFEEIGLDGDVLLQVFDALSDESGEVGDSLEKLRTNDALAALAEDGFSLEEAVKAVSDALASGATADEITAILTQSGTDTETALAAIDEVAGNVTSSIDDAKAALEDFFRADVDPTNIHDLVQGIIAQLPSLQRQFEGIELDFGGIVSEAQTGELSDDIAQMIQTAISDGLSAGAITDEASLNDFIDNLRGQVTQADLSPEVEKLFTDALALFDPDTADVSSIFTPLAEGAADQATLDAVRTNMEALADSGIEGFSGRLTDADTSAAWAHLADPTAYRASLEAGGKQAADAVIAGFTGTGTSGGGGTSAVGITGPSGGTTGIGQSLVAGVVDAITAALPDVTKAGRETAAGFGKGAATGVRPAVAVGVLMSAGLVEGVSPAVDAVGSVGAEAGDALTSGFGGSASEVIGVARFTGFGMVAAFGGLSSSMYAIGANAGNALARGFVSQVRAAAAAAAAVAIAVVQTTRNVLQISSPSKVFVNIGKQVGQGFIQGIKDTEGDIAEAMTRALSGAMEQAVRATKGAVERAQAAGGIFEMLAPSVLPGGTTRADVELARLNQIVSVGGFRSDLQEGAAARFAETTQRALADAATEMRDAVYDLRSALRDTASAAVGNLGSSALFEARAAVDYIGANLAQHVIDIRQQYREAQDARQALIDYDNDLRQIGIDYRSGALGQAAYREQLRDLQLDYKAGRLDAEAYNERVKALNKELSSGVLNFEAYERALDELGERPAAVTYEQQQILRSGPTTLNARFAGGQENIAAVSDLFSQIASWGQAAIEAGANVGRTIDQMERFRDSLTRQLQSYGFNRAEILRLVQALGLADGQLAALERTLTTLNTKTEAGQANREAIIASFESIRAWGEEAIRTGQSAARVTDEMERQRNALVAELRTRGFNVEAIRNIIRQLGLTNVALNQFQRDLVTLNTATVAGAQNRIALLEQFQGVRDFAQEMIDAGIPIANVLTNVRTLRDQIINQAVAFGFNRAQVQSLVEMLGLSNSQLADFIKQLNNFTNEAKNAEQVAAEAAAEAKKRQEDAAAGKIVGSESIPRARINELHIHVPTGDPEAVALVVGNRLAYERVAAW
jgi:tape measure domain-containing protein